MIQIMKKLVYTILAAATLLTSCSPKDGSLSGAGATFPAPFYNIVFKKYSQASQNEITYGAIGSGGGIRNLTDKTVDFGATDVFLSDAELSEINGKVLHIPTTVGAVVLSYNLSGIKDLKLTADLISDIFLGNITNWNDARIAAINEGISLPNQAITPIFRSDGSGTTSVFSEYMSKVNENWKNSIGEGKSLKFPVGVAAKGNPGVAGVIAETVGSIGYLGSEYALALNIPSAILQNSTGNFVKADTESISAAANVDMADDTRSIITNSSDPSAYPISTMTWIILYQEQSYNNRPEAKAKALVDLLKYVTGPEGQEIAVKSHYAPLSQSTKQKVDKILASITFNGKPLAE